MLVFVQGEPESWVGKILTVRQITQSHISFQFRVSHRLDSEMASAIDRNVGRPFPSVRNTALEYFEVCLFDDRLV